jgi:hypothetical protein
MKRIIFPVLLLGALFATSTAHAQAALLYNAMPPDTSVPPLYPGQPSQVTTAYLWLDDLMRLEPESAIQSYISSLSWNDTAQTIASNLYQIQDDNPLSYYNWDAQGINPNPYQGVPGQAELAFINQVSQIEPTGVVSGLLASEIISDVTVSDTACYTNPSALLATDAILANCVINDEIKGKWVPACPGSPHARKKSPSTLGVASPISALPADSASVGTCLQFEYSPEWKQIPSNQFSPLLGGWIKPGREYIVFLSFVGTGGGFTTWPLLFGTCGGMYPVVGGIVQYPHDDLSLGGTNLTLSAFKAALRAKISALITP